MIATTYPPCPDCGALTQLIRDTQETTRGTPRTWWCPTCTTHLRRRPDGTWDVLDLTPDGALIHRAAPWGGQRAVHRALAILADDRLHGSARLVGAALALHADPQGQVRASLRTVAQWAAIGDYHNVTRACRELRQWGWLRWRRTRFQVTTYQLADAPVVNMTNGPAPAQEG
jgi:hypothetical protein